MTDKTWIDEKNPNGLIDNYLDNYNTPEAKKQREEARKKTIELADEIIHTATWREISELQNNVLLSCLRTNASIYKDYADTIKENPEYQKYLQFYHFNWKDFIIIPIIDKKTHDFCIKTVKLEKNWNQNLITRENSFNSRDSKNHPYTKDSNVFSVMIHDDSKQYWYSTISMNKRTWEISQVDPMHYKMDEKGINWLLDTIWDKAWKKISDCSEWLQNTIREFVWKENELRQESQSFDEQKSKLAQSLKNWDFSWAVDSFVGMVRSFFNRKSKWRVINLWKWLNYSWDEWDFQYLQTAIDTDLDPEQRSKFTYLISKIKDKRMKDELNWKGVENPSSFDLFLQQCKPWQVMLTNALDLKWSSSSFKYATQAVSWSRWCHALLISDVVKDNNWVVVDAKIIQSTLKWWVHETTLKDYVKSNYSAADFLLADLPGWKAKDVIKNARSKIWEKYDRVSIVTDSIFWIDVDKSSSSSCNIVDDVRWKFLWKNRVYCSELVFDSMEKSWLKMPQPHMSPSDILMTDELSPQYACYCDRF